MEKVGSCLVVCRRRINTVDVDHIHLRCRVPIYLDGDNGALVLVELVDPILVVCSIIALDSLAFFKVLIPPKTAHRTCPGVLIFLVVSSLLTCMDTDKRLNAETVLAALLTKLYVLVIPKAEAEPRIACGVSELVNTNLKIYAVILEVYLVGSLEGRVRVRIFPGCGDHLKSLIRVLVSGNIRHIARIVVKILRLDRINRPIAVYCRYRNGSYNESCNKHCCNEQY